MLKKVLTVILLCVVVISFASSLCFASVESLDIQASGCNHGYNGSYYYDQAWARVRPSGSNYNVYVSIVNGNGIAYGRKKTIVYNNTTTTCYSKQFQSSGGVAAAVSYDQLSN